MQEFAALVADSARQLADPLHARRTGDLAVVEPPEVDIVSVNRPGESGDHSVWLDSNAYRPVSCTIRSPKHRWNIGEPDRHLGRSWNRAG